MLRGECDGGAGVEGEKGRRAREKALARAAPVYLRSERVRPRHVLEITISISNGMVSYAPR